MHKYRVTNISGEPKFLIEAGRLLQPKASVTVNRLDAKTMEDTTTYLVEAGRFDKPSPASKAPKPPVNWYDDEDRPQKAKAAAPVDDAPAKLVDSPKQRGARIVPLVAVGKDDAKDEAADDEPVLSSGEKPDDDGLGILAGISPKQVRDESDVLSGFVTRKLTVAAADAENA